MGVAVVRLEGKAQLLLSHALRTPRCELHSSKHTREQDGLWARWILAIFSILRGRGPRIMPTT